MSLKEYVKKRNLKESKEPAAEIKSSGISREHKNKGKVMLRKPRRLSSFVVHEHHASHLHWDLRLEMEGVLKSWAVPKEPPTEKGIKRLAVHVEDHPLAYAKFKGIIPEGNYGAGEVKIFDNGKYDLLERTPSKILFELHGKKLKGKYVLIKTSFGSKPEKSWLWFKI